MKKISILMPSILMVSCLFVSCSSSPKEEKGPEETIKHFFLTSEAKDAIDVFTASASGLTWAKGTEQTPCPLTVIAKKTSEDNDFFKECLLDGVWGKADGGIRPATYHFDIKDEPSLFRMQIQCLNEEQGLCTVKFASSLMQNRDSYAGTEWNISIGYASDLKKMAVDVDDYFENGPLYTAIVTIVD